MTDDRGEPAILIRAFTAADMAARLADLAALLVDVVAQGASVNFLHGFDQADGVAFWQGQIAGVAAGQRQLFVALAGDALIGTVILSYATQPNSPHRGEIGKMLVSPGWRRRGLGSRLLATAEAAAVEAGRTTLMLDTEAGSAGEALYRQAGWQVLGTVPEHSLTPDGRMASATFFYKILPPKRFT
jgi:GNAT superfamily N-acetyltransferase